EEALICVQLLSNQVGPALNARSALDKIEAAIPEDLVNKLNASKLFTLRFEDREDIELTLDICRQAIRAC
ncbi:MAG: DNA-binding transcriptional regulator, partial [Thiotrichales bacterium]